MHDLFSGKDIVSFVALGDSLTEGLDDPYIAGEPVSPNTRYRGWADRLAEHLVASVGEVRYANLAIRGRLMRQIALEQVPRAEELHPDLITLCAGGNDIIRPGANPDHVAAMFEQTVARLAKTGATIVIFTGADTGFQPAMRHLRGRVATYNMHLRAIADRHGCVVVDLWGMKALQDRRAWSWDRLHFSSEGHARLALKACEALGVPTGANADEPWPEAPPVAWRLARRDDLHWAREFLVPWIGRRLTGRSSGDGRAAKRPELEPLHREH